MVTLQTEYNRKRSLKALYGISLEEYNELFLAQDGRCSICGIHQSELNKSLYVDHDHKSGKIRGLLCMNCNMGIGLFKDDLDLIMTAMDYIKNSKTGKISDGRFSDK